MSILLELDHFLEKFSGGHCPKCSSYIESKLIEESFECPNCSAELKSNKPKVRFYTIYFGVLGFPLVLVFVGYLVESLNFKDANFYKLYTFTGLIYAIFIGTIRALKLKIEIINQEE